MKIVKKIVISSIILLLISKINAGVVKPEHHGVFVVDGEQIIELNSRDVDQANLIGYVTLILIGLKDDKTEGIPTVCDTPYFVIYGQAPNIEEWKITSLKYTEMYQDVIIRRDPFKIDMWLPGEAVTHDVQSIEGLTGGFVLKPKGKLKEGLYVLHFCSLEPLTYIGVVDRQVYPFVVGTAKKTIEEINLKGIPIYTVCYFLKNPNVYFMGSDGVIFKKDGKQYKSITHPFLKGAISRLTVDPTNNQVLFVVSQDNTTVVFSNDGGLTWKTMDLYVFDFWGNHVPILYFNSIKIDPWYSNIVALAAKGKKNGIFMASLNGGDTWEIAKIQDEIVFDVTSNGSKIFFSTNEAIYSYEIKTNKFKKIPDSPQGIKFLQIMISDKDKIFGATEDGKIYYSSNAGETFALTLSTNRNIVSFAVASSSLWIATHDEIYKITDNGVNLTKIENFPKCVVKNIAINPMSENEILVGTETGLYVSKDGGLTWSSADSSSN